MTEVTIRDYREHPSLSYALHQQARRERARAIGRLFKRFFERAAEGLAALRRPPVLGAHCG